MAPFNWYINRLLSMEPGELPYRLLKRFSGTSAPQKTSWDTDTIRDHRHFLRERLSPDSLFDLDVDPDPEIFDQPLSLDQPPDWFRCPKTGHSAREQSFRREGGRNNQFDIRYVRELNRMQYLLPFYLHDRDNHERQKDRVVMMIQDWIRKNPPYDGINWTSGLEASLRLYQWGMLFLLFDEIERPFLDTWLQSINLHMSFVSQHFSRFSSANNHLIGEASGLFVASLIWPGLDPDQQYLYRAHRTLEEEIRKQLGPDGFSVEQSTGYHRFVMELFLYPLLFEHVLDRSSFSEEFYRRFGSGIQTLHRFRRGKAHPPTIGDDDDGMVLRLSASPAANVDRICALGSTVAGLPNDSEDVFSDEHQFWNLPVTSTTSTTDRQTRTRSIETLPEDGYTFFNVPSAHIELIFVHGPVGHGTLAAHGHADALSVLLYVHDEPLLVDPGTFTYHGDREWRDYFRGTTAHNTLSIGGRNQARNAGRFLWTHHYRCRVIEQASSQQELMARAMLRGYRHCSFFAKHLRSVSVRTNAIRLVDRVHIDQPESYQQNFHLHPETQLKQDGPRSVVLKRSGGSFRMRFASEGSLRIHAGERYPVSGWHSTQFERKTPCPVVQFEGHITPGVNTLPVQLERLDR